MPTDPELPDSWPIFVGEVAPSGHVTNALNPSLGIVVVTYTVICVPFLNVVGLMLIEMLSVGPPPPPQFDVQGTLVGVGASVGVGAKVAVGWGVCEGPSGEEPGACGLGQGVASLTGKVIGVGVLAPVTDWTKLLAVLAPPRVFPMAPAKLAAMPIAAQSSAITTIPATPLIIARNCALVSQLCWKRSSRVSSQLGRLIRLGLS